MGCWEVLGSLSTLLVPSWPPAVNCWWQELCFQSGWADMRWHFQVGRLPRCCHHNQQTLLMSFVTSWTTASSIPDFPSGSSRRPHVVTAKPAPKARGECERKLKTHALLASLDALISGRSLHIRLEVITDFLGCLQGGNRTSLHWLDV